MNEASEFKATALCVVCESYDDSRTFPQLVGAKAQMEEIAGLLEGLGFDVRLVGGGNPDRAAFDREVEEWSEGWRRSGGRKPALILWSGHGVLADDELRLVLSDLKPGDHVGTRKVRIRRQGVSTEELIGYAVSSEADQILVVVDTCYAGDGVGDGVRTVLKHWSEISLPPGRTKWLGSMASCQRNETSDGDGPLLRALAAVLREGPRTDEYLSAWSAHNELVSGVELLAALPTRWEAEGQRPARAAVGDERPAFPNPLARPGTAPALVEHLVLAARGVGHREEGWFFSGRQRVLGEIIAWMEAATPGLFLVTGPAGCGKSAVLGRVATLADPEQRQEAERQGALREGDPDPGVRDARSFAAVHLRGLDATQAAAELAARLGLPEPRNADALRAELRELPTPPVLVLDGLDEVPAEHTQGVIEELVFPLSRMLPVLVGSRERPFRGRLKEGETLPDALVRHIGDSVTTVDLEAEPDTRQDIAEYVRRRCEAAEVDGAGVAEALADRATAQDGGFLFARLVTGFLVARLRELEGLQGTEDLLSGLPDSVEAAFEEDLHSGPRRVRDDGTELPSAARDLLTALAWAAGRGMPAGGVWEAVASALGGQGVVYDEGDLDWVLSAYGRYIVEDGAGTQAVYRLYHREFVSHLRRREGPGRAAAEVVVLRAVVDLLKRQAEAGGWERVDPYVQTWLSRHAAWASVPGPGIDVLRDLVVWDRENALPHLAEALLEVSVALSGNAHHTAAVEFAREATDIYRDLADRDTVCLPDLAGSLNNLANHLAEAGDRQGALEPAHEAVRHYTQLARTNPAAYLPNLAGSLNNLAIRLAETGDRQGALEPAHEAVRIRRQLAHTNPAAYLPNLAMALNNLANHLAETGDEPAAIQAYTDTAAGLAQAHPAATRAIEYERAAFQLGRPEPTRTSGLLGLIRIVNDESADQPGEIALRARQTLRAHAHTSRDCRESLEQTWRQETDTAAPDWLSLSEDTLNLVVEWVNTPTWTDSRTFWSRHADALGDDEAATALAEFALAWPVAEQHQRIRELVLSEGVDSVFPALILRDTLSGWLACENWDDSKRFFQEHSELLLDESAEKALTETDDVTPGIAVHAALLRIARTEDIDTAFQCVQDRGALQRHALRALNDGDAQALAYAAAIEGSVFDDELSSATHHQAALLLAGDPESLDLDALAEAASEADPETRNRLTSELATLATRSSDPQHTAHWFRLVQALTQTRP
ncbi:hypothetical protein FHS41_005747 [Streptomyces violarus]|uniref:Peptidase C14 caspase domain-containing protein n=1 Tax=Streptomyces violarus TaxID=67380 RepID=A0A7W5F3Z3_9ACTN|nr:tetratricopeptide repeat protein [Streptomyces violarus]MBB3079215.1 hypothetical protein [Streptomyces violarus]